jgi:hypothetical protein
MSKPYSIKSVSKSIATHVKYNTHWYILVWLINYTQSQRSVTILITSFITIIIATTLANHDTPDPKTPAINTIINLTRSKSQLTPFLYTYLASLPQYSLSIILPIFLNILMRAIIHIYIDTKLLLYINSGRDSGFQKNILLPILIRHARIVDWTLLPFQFIIRFATSWIGYPIDTKLLLYLNLERDYEFQKDVVASILIWCARIVIIYPIIIYPIIDFIFISFSNFL